MNFRPRQREEPELNLIPMIDVLIVLLIFLVLTTTFSREAQLRISLPDAPGAVGEAGHAQAVQIVISAEGRYRIGQQELPDSHLATVKAALQAAAGGNPDPLIVIDADRATPHQSVIMVLDAAGLLGYRRVSLAAENRGGD